MLGGLEPFRDRYSLSSVTVLSPLFATQTWVPSEETPSGVATDADGLDDGPGRGVQLGHRVADVVEFVTQTWVPSEEMPIGNGAHDDSLDDRPGRGVQLGHRLPSPFATQTWVPSEEMPWG